VGVQVLRADALLLGVELGHPVVLQPVLPLAEVGDQAEHEQHRQHVPGERHGIEAGDADDQDPEREGDVQALDREVERADVREGIDARDRVVERDHREDEAEGCGERIHAVRAPGCR